MPKLDELPPLAVIVGLKGVLDFYYWKGIPCVRKWPRIPPAHRTPASLQSAALFGAIIQGYALLGGTLKTFFSEDAADQPRTGRDIYISATLGHLHEAPMADILALLTEIRDYTLALTDLAHALESVATDRLIVRGEDQVFTYKEQVLEQDYNTNAANGTNTLNSSIVQPGEIWIVTTAAAINDNTVCSMIRIQVGPHFPAPRLAQLADPPIQQSVHIIGPVLLIEGDFLTARFENCVLGDNIYFALNGHKMTLET